MPAGAEAGQREPGARRQRPLELARRPRRRRRPRRARRAADDARRKRCASYREAIETAVSRVAEAGAGGRAYRHVAELLGLFSERFAAAKERRAGVDFEDLQMLAVRLLERTEVGAAYRSRFRHLMVDEFQDTNRLQLRLIEALRGPDGAADGRRRRAPVDLRLPPRRPRGLPRAARADRRRRRTARCCR